MRIEQYFLMTDYSLWEVILNSDSPAPTRVIDGVWKRIRLKRDKSEQKRTKPDKNGKRVEAGKNLKQLQWVEEEKRSKTQKEWPKMQKPVKSYSRYKKSKKTRA
uniref:Uncharacterized protein n=1 Tax=Tanacetum cinerariifolium TaxID=118510 RepID=A0A699TDQ2_TANCI|nr:hypothetical protein [Tanacetum cinerariifolium]